MKHLSPSWSAALAVLAVGCILPHIRAGEAIQFSNSRSRLDPTAKSKLQSDLENERLGRVAPPMDFLPAGESSRRDPARTRKQQNAAAERANWMTLDRGQLDAQDEQKRAMGIRQANSEKDPDRKDYFFTPLNEKDGLARSPFARSTAAREHSDSAPDAKDIPENGKPEEASDPRRNQVLGKDGQPLGEHTAKELDLKDLLNTGKANSLAPGADRTALMWKDVLGFAGDAGRRREDGTTADSYRGTTSAGSVKSADSLSFRNELRNDPLRNDPSARASISAQAGPLESPRNFNMVAPPVAPRAAESAFSRGPSTYATPSLSADGGADPYAALRQPQPPPSRPISGGSAIPSRPGYGGR